MPIEADPEKLFRRQAPTQRKHSLVEWLLVEPGFDGSPWGEEYIRMDAVMCMESAARFGLKMRALMLANDSLRIDQMASFDDGGRLFDPIKVDQAAGEIAIPINTGAQGEDKSEESESPKISLSYNIIDFFRHHLVPPDRYTIYRDRYINKTNQILEIIGQQKFPPYNL